MTRLHKDFLGKRETRPSLWASPLKPQALPHGALVAIALLVPRRVHSFAFFCESLLEMGSFTGRFRGTLETRCPDLTDPGLLKRDTKIILARSLAPQESWASHLRVPGAAGRASGPGGAHTRRTLCAGERRSGLGRKRALRGGRGTGGGERQGAQLSRPAAPLCWLRPPARRCVPIQHWHCALLPGSEAHRPLTFASVRSSGGISVISAFDGDWEGSLASAQESCAGSRRGARSGSSRLGLRSEWRVSQDTCEDPAPGVGGPGCCRNRRQLGVHSSPGDPCLLGSFIRSQAEGALSTQLHSLGRKCGC